MTWRSKKFSLPHIYMKEEKMKAKMKQYWGISRQIAKILLIWWCNVGQGSWFTETLGGKVKIRNMDNDLEV